MADDQRLEMLPSVLVTAFSDRYDLVVDAVEALPPEYAEIVSMRMWGQYSFREIGEELGVTKQTVHDKWQRALGRLEAMIGAP